MNIPVASAISRKCKTKSSHWAVGLSRNTEKMDSVRTDIPKEPYIFQQMGWEVKSPKIRSQRYNHLTHLTHLNLYPNPNF